MAMVRYTGGRELTPEEDARMRAHVMAAAGITGSKQAAVMAIQTT